MLLAINMEVYLIEKHVEDNKEIIAVCETNDIAMKYIISLTSQTACNISSSDWAYMKDKWLESIEEDFTTLFPEYTNEDFEQAHRLYDLEELNPEYKIIPIIYINNNTP